MKKSLWLVLCVVAPNCFAAIQGLHFQHKDWELACDNTGTCRAVGYQANQEPNMALLLQRVAGQPSPIEGFIQVLPEQAPKTAQLWLDDEALGMLSFDRNIAQLTTEQLEKLIEKAQQYSKIELVNDQTRWKLSDAGMSAILQKMDEFQRREGTKSALVTTGRKSQGQLLQAEPMPNYVMTDYHRGSAVHYALNSVPAQNLHSKFKALTDEKSCPLLWQQHTSAQDRISIYPLNRQHFLVQTPCWRSAYNQGYGMWVVSKDLRYVQQMVTTNATSFSEGHIFSHQKGRGLGDCGTQQEWVWMAPRFIRSYVAQNSQCKGFVGGAWKLPTFVSQVSSQ